MAFLCRTGWYKIAEVGDPSIVRWRSTWFEKSSISQTPLKLSLDMNFFPQLASLYFVFLTGSVFWLFVRLSNLRIEKMVTSFTEISFPLSKT